MKKIVAIDFDGTLVKNKYPFCENPNMVLIDWIKAHRNEYIFILNTCREGKQLKYAIDYMKDEFGIVFDYVNENVPENIKKYGDCRKIFADLYIDDASITTDVLKKQEKLAEE